MNPTDPLFQLMFAGLGQNAANQQQPNVGGGDMLKMLQLILGKQTSLPENLSALRNDPQGDANKSYTPGAVAGSPNAAGNPFTNGFFNAANSSPGAMMTVDPAARATTERDMMAAFAPRGQVPIHALPFTQNSTAPLPQNPGFGSPQYPSYQNAAQQIFARATGTPFRPVRMF